MNLIRMSIERPIAVLAAVLMIVLFGLLALQTIPIQLTPDVRRPILNIQTNWHGAAPAEMEREIINRQEEALKGLPGVTNITSRAEDGRARINLEFDLSQNMDRALLLVANRLDRVTGYPEEAKEYKDIVEGRSMLVKKTELIPIECVVRGYIVGSGWKEYLDRGTVCDIKLPEGLEQASKLSEPLFTPAFKAEEGHDENISLAKMKEIVGEKLTEKLLTAYLQLIAHQRKTQQTI